MKDAIGDRLDHPERVPPEFQHLIADDVARVEAILSIPVQGRVLDVGASDGAISRRIAARWGVEVVAADLHPGPGQFPWDVRDPWPTLTGIDRFDAVYCCEVLEHLVRADAYRAYTHLLHVLRPGGTLIVTVPNRRCEDVYTAGCRDRWRWPSHRSVWAKASFEHLMRRGTLATRAIRGLPEPCLADKGIWILGVGVK